MAVLIKTIDESIQSNGVKICVHGPAGAGKTVLCTTLAENETGIIISAENGLLSLQDVPPEIKKRLGVIEVTTMQEMGDAVRAFDGEKLADWIFPDSISEIAEVVLYTKKGETPDPRKAYGSMADDMLALIRALRDLPGYNVMMTAKQHRVDGFFSPMLPGKQLGDQLPYLFDEVFALRVEPDGAGGFVRVLQTGKDLVYDAKDRSGRLDMFEPANIAYIARKIGSATTVPADRPVVERSEQSSGQPMEDGEEATEETGANGS